MNYSWLDNIFVCTREGYMDGLRVPLCSHARKSIVEHFQNTIDKHYSIASHNGARYESDTDAAYNQAIEDMRKALGLEGAEA